MPRRVVIAGAGHAGGTAAALLRQLGHDGPITLIGQESTPPYQRPPLSKAYLEGAADIGGLQLKPEAFYAERGIELRLGEVVDDVDPDAQVVSLKGGADLAYDVLILATGSTNRPLDIAGARPGELLELRSIADADRLRAALAPGRRLLIIGGGYVGLETAASATRLGAEVAILELAPRVLARAASEEMSAALQRIHRERGVDILTGAQVTRLERSSSGQISAARLSDGRSLPCDRVLVGVGAAPCCDLARAARLDCEGGVLVDEDARTSDPNIYALGDMTVRPLPHYAGRKRRLESVPNAMEQARQAAAAILGLPRPLPEVPWFWSDQYELKLQMAGLPIDADEKVVRGSPAEGRFAVFYLKGDCVRAVEALNCPAEFMAGRRLIQAGLNVDRVRLADMGVSMKQMAAS
jgi:3-phenylpropionate/trans-cinnamate dioxygenase ferredoxin reductase subunit